MTEALWWAALGAVVLAMAWLLVRDYVAALRYRRRVARRLRGLERRKRFWCAAMGDMIEQPLGKEATERLLTDLQPGRRRPERN